MDITPSDCSRKFFPGGSLKNLNISTSQKKKKMQIQNKKLTNHLLILSYIKESPWALHKRIKKIKNKNP
jgi:hypothetical protein